MFLTIINFGLCEFGHVRIVKHFGGRFNITFGRFVLFHFQNDRFNFRTLAGQVAEAIHVIGSVGGSQHGIDFF